MSVGSKKHVKWVTPDLKRVVKRVIFPFTVAKQKTTPHKIKHGKDGRRIAPRKKASAGEGSKEQLWSVADLDLCFWPLGSQQEQATKGEALKASYQQADWNTLYQCVSDSLDVVVVVEGGK